MANTKTKIKVSFKKIKEVGSYSAFQPKFTDIKINGKKCGSIFEKDHYYQVKIAVEKTPEIEDGNTNCSWRNTTFKPKFPSEEDARKWVEEKIDDILDAYTVHYYED